MDGLIAGFLSNTGSRRIKCYHLSKKENGNLLPSIDIMQRLMKVFVVSADNLLNDSENSVVELQNRNLNVYFMLINQLDEDEKKCFGHNHQLNAHQKTDDGFVGR